VYVPIYDLVSSTADDILKKVNTRDALKIAEELGVKVVEQRMGKLQGMYNIIQNVCFISLSVKLDEPSKIIVCFHELGHHVFDRRLAADKGLKDFTIHNIKDPVELRASMLGAELRFRDEDILEMAYAGYTVNQMAMATGAYPDFVGIKLDLLRHKGYDLNITEYSHHNVFKVAEDRDSGSDYFSY